MELMSYIEGTRESVQVGEQFNFCVDVVIGRDEKDEAGEPITERPVRILLDVPSSNLSAHFKQVEGEVLDEGSTLHRLKIPLKFDTDGNHEFAMSKWYGPQIIGSQESAFSVIRQP